MLNFNDLPYEETPRLRRVAARLLADEAAADDVVQDVWLATLQRVSELEDPRTWLTAVTRNIARTRRRAQHSRAHCEQRVAAERKDPDARTDAAARALRDSMHAAVLGLAEPLRSTMRLHYLEELTVPEVAARLGLRPTTVQSQVRRGLERLRARLDRECGGPRTWSLGPVAALDCGSRERGGGRDRAAGPHRGRLARGSPGVTRGASRRSS